MADIDWTAIMQSNGQKPERRGPKPNVKFFYAYLENRDKSLAEGRPVFDEIPSVSIQYPGMDETVRRIEREDTIKYAEQYARFKAGTEPVTDGMPLSEWTPMTGSAMRELQYLGFRTVEQLAAATDETKRKLGPLARFVKLAKDWLDAANSSQNEVVKLKQQLENETNNRKQLEHKLELFMQRIEANEGTDLRPMRKQMRDVVFDEELEEGIVEIADEQLSQEPKRRGRPKKA